VIGIVGTRKRSTPRNMGIVKKAFLEVYEEGDWICSGGCEQGADNFAERFARKYGIPIVIFHADWDKHGKAAGPIRNTIIAKYSDVLIACVARTRKGGTEDTITKFEKRRGKKAIIV